VEPLRSIDRLSFNQITADRLSLQEAVTAVCRAQVPWISLWRHKVADAGLAESKRIVKDAGLRVSSLCRGGFFPAPTPEARRERIDDNRRAIEEAAELGTDTLVLVCGPAPDRDIGAARRMVEEAIAELAPYARACGVKLGIEPLHPMYAGDRSVVNTLGQANAIAERFDARDVGVVIDAFHVWWDPDLYAQIERAKGRILGFHVSDWLVPLPDPLMGRGMMGDGVIELRRMRYAVEAAGYDGPIEVEIFNRDVWDMAPDEALALIKERYLQHV